MEKANLHHNIMEEDKDCVTVGKQEVKTTAKSMEDTLQRKIGSRRANLIQLTAKNDSDASFNG